METNGIQIGIIPSSSPSPSSKMYGCLNLIGDALQLSTDNHQREILAQCQEQLRTAIEEQEMRIKFLEEQVNLKAQLTTIDPVTGNTVIVDAGYPNFVYACDPQQSFAETNYLQTTDANGTIQLIQLTTAPGPSEQEILAQVGGISELEDGQDTIESQDAGSLMKEEPIDGFEEDELDEDEVLGIEPTANTPGEAMNELRSRHGSKVVDDLLSGLLSENLRPFIEHQLVSTFTVSENHKESVNSRNRTLMQCRMSPKCENLPPFRHHYTCLRHMLKVHFGGYRPFPCEDCGHKAFLKYELKAHRDKHASAAKYECHHNGCTFRARDRKELQAHMARHATMSNKEFACGFPTCDKKFSSMRHLKDHKSSVHNGGQNNSNNNSISFSASYSPAAIETQQYNQNCPQCPAKFRTAARLQRHIDSVHLKPLACPVEECEHRADNLDLLNQHIEESHHDQKDILFLVAARTTAASSSSSTPNSSHDANNAHINKNSRSGNGKQKQFRRPANQGNIACGYEGCTKRFYRKWMFKNHIREHIEGTIHPCKFCHIKLNSTEERNQHESQCKARRFDCKFADCNFSTISQADFDRHQMIVHKIRPCTVDV